MNSYNEWANFTTPAPQEGESVRISLNFDVDYKHMNIYVS